ncbi:MAG: hypothetical protein ABSC42_17050, partial [Tepidisphaeraceae bacterium]
LASFAIQAIVMLVMLDRKVGGLGLAFIAGRAFRMLLACAVMAAACCGVQMLRFYPHGAGHLASTEQLAILMLVGGAAYAGASVAFGLRVSSLMRTGD